MTGRCIYTLLREKAREELGVNVYRPRDPSALFVCAKRPDRAAVSFFETEEKGHVYLTPVRDLLVSYAADIPFFRDTAVYQDDTDAVLCTCARRCLRETRPAGDTELAVRVLYRLAFGEKEQLAGELPGMMALRLRRHEGLDILAGKLIMAELWEEIQK